MAWAVAGALSLLAGMNILIAGSSLYPPAVFAGVWAGLVLALALSGDAFYPVSLQTMLVYLSGALAFSAGGFLSLLASRLRREEYPRVSARRRRFMVRIFDATLLVLLLAFPLYWRRLAALSAGSGMDDFWIGLRLQVMSGARGEGGLGPFEYLTAWASFMALAALYESDGSRAGKARTFSLIILAFLYQLFSTARAGAVLLALGLMGVALLRGGRVRLRPLVAGAFVFLLIFALPAVVLRKGGSPTSDIAENIAGVFESLRLYGLGALVAFDRVTFDPGSVESGWRSLGFFASAANALGADVMPPPAHLEYTATPMPTNVYTIYFPYFSDYGWMGMLAIMGALGGVTAWIFRSAVRGKPQAVILYGLILGALALSGFTEPFLTGMSYWIQAAVAVSVLYRWPLLPLWTRRWTSSS
jgi:oligosaccharide repeat unit polymerase